MLRTPMLLLATLALVSTPVLADQMHAHTVTVSLEVTLAGQPHAACSLQVPYLADGAAVLDAALASECITSWAAEDFGEDGQPNYFVSEMDGIEQAALGLASSWSMYLNGQMTGFGISGYGAQQDDVLAFDYDAAFAKYVANCVVTSANPLC